MLKTHICKIFLFGFIAAGLVLFIYGITQIPQGDTKQLLQPGQTTQDLTNQKNAIALASLGFMLTMIGLGATICGILMLWFLMYYYIANEVAVLPMPIMIRHRQIQQAQPEATDSDIVNETKIENVNTIQPYRSGPHIEYHII
jgi:hypothetical protein